MSSAGGDAAAVAARLRRTFCSTVLVCEALVAFFAALVAKDLSDVSTGTLVTAASVYALVCILLCGALRAPWAYAVGSVLQLVLILSGIWLTAMFFVGVLFAVLWAASFVLSARIEQIRAGFPPPPPG